MRPGVAQHGFHPACHHCYQCGGSAFDLCADQFKVLPCLDTTLKSGHRVRTAPTRLTRATWRCGHRCRTAASATARSATSRASKRSHTAEPARDRAAGEVRRAARAAQRGWPTGSRARHRWRAEGGRPAAKALTAPPQGRVCEGRRSPWASWRRSVTRALESAEMERSALRGEGRTRGSTE